MDSRSAKHSPTKKTLIRVTQCRWTMMDQRLSKDVNGELLALQFEPGDSLVSKNLQRFPVDVLNMPRSCERYILFGKTWNLKIMLLVKSRISADPA